MAILGIDYGLSKIGLAVSSGSLAAPLKVIKYSNPDELHNKIQEVLYKEGIEGIVIGVSDGEIEKKSREFGKKFNLPVYYMDETLSTKDAERLSIEAGIKRKKRRNMEDAYAAALILQQFLDTEK